MPHPPSTDLAAPPAGPAATADLVTRAGSLLSTPNLVIVTGGPGSGRSHTLRQLTDAFRGPTYTGGGLAMLAHVPAFALARALRVRLPGHDTALLAEAVRSRVRAGLLILDDLQFADPATLAALPALATHCRVVAALRTPHRLPPSTVAALRAAAAGWLTIDPLTAGQATALARTTAPTLDDAAVTAVVRRAGGLPLAVQALARHATTGRDTPAISATGRGALASGTGDDTDRITYAIAAALSDLTRPARTAMAALGLLGRPATAALLGPGATELADAGLITTADPPAATASRTDTGDLLTPVSPYLAEVAAGLLDAPARAALHRRLAAAVPGREAARHLAAAGDHAAAYATATAAAEAAATAGERAELLLLACHLPGHPPQPHIRLAAATAALAVGRPRAALRALHDTATAAAAVLRGEALLHTADAAGATAAVADLPPDHTGPHLVAAADRIRLLAALAGHPPGTDPATAAHAVTARHGATPTHPGLRAALAAVAAHTRTPGWEYALATAAATAAAAGDALTTRTSAWLLVETLTADARLAEAADTAARAAAACATDQAYSWQTRFLAAHLWCTALHGAAGTDQVTRAANDLTDRTLPDTARGYATAAVALTEADAGLLATARARLATAPDRPARVAALLDWVDRETAWLDGQPDHAARPDDPTPATGGAPLLDGLRGITARWAAYDGAPASPPGPPPPGPPPVRHTLHAWAAATTDCEPFTTAADAWRDVAVREQVRCLLAYGLHSTDTTRAVPPLLAAEQLAEQSGLVVLLGRTRRALRRHAVRRDNRGARSGDDLTERERAVLHLVAQGEPTRRIAGQLGISAETVETHIRAGMRKLGARTRTEAAALALEHTR